MIDRDRLAAEGYTTAPLLPRSTINQLRKAFSSLGVDPEHHFLASANLDDRIQVREIHHLILELTRHLLAAAVPDHEVFLASFLSKGAREGAAVSFHQDLTYTDEREHRTIVVWVPLVDVDVDNGALQVVPGSHRWMDGSRPGGLDVLPTEPWQDALGAQAIVVPLEAGTCIAYDAATVHGSPPNTGGAVRPAVGFALHPADAPLVHVHAGRSEPSAHRVDLDYYLDVGLTNPPVGYPSYALWAPPVATQDLRPHLDPQGAPA